MIDTTLLPDNQIVYLDPNITAEMMDELKKVLLDSHARYPFTRPVSVNLASGGGYVINEGYIVTMTQDEIAERHKENLKQGKRDALIINKFLCTA